MEDENLKKGIEYILDNYDEIMEKYTLANRGGLEWSGMIPPDEDGKSFDERMEGFLGKDGEGLTDEMIKSFWQGEIERGERASLVQWEQNFNKILTAEQARKDLIQKVPNCPFCGLELDKLKLLFFRSPEWTWDGLCGRAGWVVVCPECVFQVYFDCRVMS